jgi:hypothetical protein
VSTLVLSSPRTRRRLAWLIGAVLVAAAITAAAVFMPTHSAAVKDDAASSAALPAHARTAQPVGEARTVPPPRRALNALLDTFIPAVIARRNLAAGWNLVTPDARGSRADWMRGTTPFQTYDARIEPFHGWTLNYSYPDDVGFDIFVAPRNPKDVSMAFRGEAKKIAGKWKIAVFYPQATFQPAGKRAAVWADKDLQPQAAAATATSGRLSATWLLLPVGFVGAVVAIALSFVLVRMLRRRARVKQIERELALTR